MDFRLYQKGISFADKKSDNFFKVFSTKNTQNIYNFFKGKGLCQFLGFFRKQLKLSFYFVTESEKDFYEMYKLEDFIRNLGIESSDVVVVVVIVLFFFS